MNIVVHVIIVQEQLYQVLLAVVTTVNREFVHGEWSTNVLYVNDILWDGQQCGGLEGPCCTNSKMPWFIKTLNENTTEDIELRVMADESTSNEDIQLDIIELYIH